MLMLAGGFALPVMAASPPTPLDVSQVPSAPAQKGIAPNLFLLLDDSGSMQFEYLGSKGNDIDGYKYGFPPGLSDPYDGGLDCRTCAPGFEADDKDAQQYRSSFVNPNYYNPAITYTPWACASNYPASGDPSEDHPVSPLNGFDCHWDADIGLWVTDPAAPTTAYLNPANTDAGFRSINVWNDSNDATNQTPFNGYAGFRGKTGTRPFWPATYFNYFGDRPGSNNDFRNADNYRRVQICPATATTNSNGVASTDVCTPPPILPANPEPYHTYTDESGQYVYIRGDGTQIVRTSDEALQNFANWYQYYRSHVLLLNAGIGIAFMQIPTGLRVNYGVINTMEDLGGAPEITSIENFTYARRLEFLKKLYTQDIDPDDNAPIRLALKHVGEWFDDDAQSSTAPWGNSTDETEAAASTPLSCRANYVILVADGMWNGGSPGVGNVDNSDGDAITDGAGHSYRYKPVHPYQDNYPNTLADVAMDYWNRDLQSGMDNNVPTNTSDAAFWQHLVTFTVGLGVQPTLVENYMADPDHANATPAEAQQAVFRELVDGTESWPEPSADSPHNIDDTWHAAVNGHGRFASAGNPTELHKAISDALVNIVNRIGATSSPSFNAEKTGQTRTRQKVFQALFHPQNWWGDVLALPVTVTRAPNIGTVVTISRDADWSASCVLTGGDCPQMGLTASGQPIHTITRQPPSERTMLTWNGFNGVAFDMTLAASAASVIGGADIINYIRGVRTSESGRSGSLRARTSVMGDVVLSLPIFVGAPGADYPDVWANLLNLSATPPENQAGAQTYSDFTAAQASRKPVVYVGANDGMLHGFYAPPGATTAGAGKELLAYVPRAVWPNLKDYASMHYAHHYFVNATPGVGDLFYGGTWRTWLVGGEGAGGNSVFALNITDPGNFGTADVIGEWGPTNICDNAGSRCDGDDLGLTFGTPVITRFNNGEWGFVFGNGFNSASGVAAIFVGLVDATTGNISFYELSTGYGPAKDSAGAKRPNGIAFVTAVDLNGDHTTDYVYAGDYFGNLWRFNLTATNPSGWGPDYAGGVGPMFTAVNAGGAAQSITTKVLVVAVPGAGAGFRVMVEFGTGAAVTNAQQTPDTTDAGVQSLYGVWDWDFDAWNSGQPSPSVDARQPSAFQYASRSIGPSGAAYTRLDLSPQSIIVEQTTGTVQGGSVNNRVVTQNPVCWVDTETALCASQDEYGWRLDLVSPKLGKRGEKVVYNPVLRSGVFLVNTTIPSIASGLTCRAAALIGWTLALNPETGGRLPFEVFDTIGNGKFEQITLSDGSKVNTSGITLGAIGSPGFVTHGGDTFLVFNTGGGKTKIQPLNLGSGNLAVQISWQELR